MIEYFGNRTTKVVFVEMSDLFIGFSFGSVQNINKTVKHIKAVLKASHATPGMIYSDFTAL